MKIRCNCGNEFDPNIVETFPVSNHEDGGFVKRACQECRRGYKISVELIQELPKWWRLG